MGEPRTSVRGSLRLYFQNVFPVFLLVLRTVWKQSAEIEWSSVDGMTDDSHTALSGSNKHNTTNEGTERCGTFKLSKLTLTRCDWLNFACTTEFAKTTQVRHVSVMLCDTWTEFAAPTGSLKSSLWHRQHDELWKMSPASWRLGGWHLRRMWSL